MPTPTITTTGDEHIDTALTATGFRWSLKPDFKIIDVVAKLQHRRDEGLNAGAVRRYVNKLKAGSIPPPICVTRDGVLIFGNHRLDSAEKANWETLPAIVIEVDGNGADENVQNQLRSVAYAENAKHGVPYSSADRAEAAKHLIALGYTNAHIQAELGLSGPTVSNIKRDVLIAERFAKLGLSTKGVSISMLRALAGPDTLALNDEPFREIVALAKAAGLKGSEISALAKEAKAAGSDVAALALVDARRQDKGMTERIAQTSLGGAPRPTPVGKLKGVLKQVNGLCDATFNPAVYREHGDQDAVTDLMGQLNQAITCLTGILSVQQVPAS